MGKVCSAILQKVVLMHFLKVELTRSQYDKKVKLARLIDKLGSLELEQNWPSFFTPGAGETGFNIFGFDFAFWLYIAGNLGKAVVSKVYQW